MGVGMGYQDLVCKHASMLNVCFLGASAACRPIACASSTGSWLSGNMRLLALLSLQAAQMAPFAESLLHTSGFACVAMCMCALQS